MSLDAAAHVMREAMRGDGQAAFGISYLAGVLALMYPIASSLAMVRLLGLLAALGYLAWMGAKVDVERRKRRTAGRSPIPHTPTGEPCAQPPLHSRGRAISTRRG